MQDLRTGAGAAWNARASLPSGIDAQARDRGHRTRPRRGDTGVWLDARPPPAADADLSDNAAANGTERYFGGSTSGGSALVNTMMRSLGLVDTQMYGGYELQALDGPPRALAGGIPLRADSQPSWGRGKSTTAYDLASLLRAVWLASGGRGPLRAAQPGFSAADGRYLLYLLAHVRDSGKLDREVGRLSGVRVLHKAGWIASARHDNGIILWRGGAIVVTVMTFRPAGAGTSADVLAGEVAASALRRFRG